MMEIRYDLPAAFVQEYKRDLERVVEMLRKEGHALARIPIRPRMASTYYESAAPERTEAKFVTLRTQKINFRYLPAIIVLSADRDSDREILEAEDAKLVKEQRDRKGAWPAWISAHD